MINLSIQSDREKLEELISNDIDAYCISKYENSHRTHLGASELGKACSRMLYYRFRWMKKPDFDGRMLRLFNVGHQAEPRFIDYLRGIGFEVKEFSTPILNYFDNQCDYTWTDIPDPLGKNVSNNAVHVSEALKRGIKPTQWHISGVNGHYGGSLDGMCKAPARYQISEDLIFLNEFKTNGTGAGFNKVSELHLAKAKPEHFAQMSQYGFHYKLKYGLYLIENKNDSSITVKIVELNWRLGEQLQSKAEEIITATEPPAKVSENPAYFECVYCTFKDICHNDAIPEKNCRSCKNSIPTENATWTCSKFGVIPESFVKTGCNEWIPI